MISAHERGVAELRIASARVFRVVTARDVVVGLERDVRPSLRRLIVRRDRRKKRVTLTQPPAGLRMRLISDELIPARRLVRELTAPAASAGSGRAGCSDVPQNDNHPRSSDDGRG